MQVLKYHLTHPNEPTSCALRTDHQALSILFKHLHFSCTIFAPNSNFKKKISFLFVSFVQFVSKYSSLSPARTKTEPKLNRKNFFLFALSTQHYALSTISAPIRIFDGSL